MGYYLPRLQRCASENAVDRLFHPAYRCCPESERQPNQLTETIFGKPNMKPLFTIHVGEYLVGEYIERNFPGLNVWLPSKDTGVDLLVTDKKNRKAVSLQVKFSKDYSFDGSPLLQSRMVAGGWWHLDVRKIQKSNADFWIFVLPSFVEKEISYIIVERDELLRRYKAIPATAKQRIDSYLRVTKTHRCWEARGLSNTDMELVALDRFVDKNRDFTKFLNAWNQIEARLK